MDGKSLSITEQKLSELKALFPDVFSEGKIDVERLKAALGEDVFVKGEHYELSWAGKTEARKEVQKQTTATLIPDKESSIDFDNAQNIFIEGENLEVLRVLQKSYFGKVKMIYIDPPYNTGNDSFVYPDDYSERRDEYNKRTGITDDEGYLNKQDLWKKNSREGGQFHSVWLSMMYPRLYLARNLLREDGVIFVSIDDNEQANLKLLMDDVFGEENFLSCIKWEKRYTRSNNAKLFTTLTEYVLAYRRSDLVSELKEPRNEKADSTYSNPDKDPRGVWTSVSYVNPATKEQRPNLAYDLTNPFSGEIVSHPTNAWKFEKNTYEQHARENRLYWGQKGENTFPRLKRFLSEVGEGMVPVDLWAHEDTGTTDAGSKALEDLFDGKVFDFPKPYSLIARMLNIATRKNDEDIVLDFFAGSSTTAHAILQANENDGSKRKFILVQIPESIDADSEAKRAGYKTIADISKARIKKVIEKLQKEREGKLDLEAEERQHLGFKAYRLAPSNFKIWRNDVEGEEALLEQLEMFTQAEKESSLPEDMLHELLLKSGFPLTAIIKQTDLSNGGTVYEVDGGKLAVCFCKHTGAVTEAILSQKPEKVVMLNSCFEKNEDLTNFKLQLKDGGIDLTII